MKPLNHKERSKAYQKVVGLFVLSFIVAIVLGFTTMNAGQLTEAKTRSDLQKLQNQLKFQQEVFAPNVDEATKILAKVPVYREQGENIEVLNSGIASVLSQTMKEVEEDGTWESDMYLNILKVYSDLQLSYREQLRMKDELDTRRNSTEGSDRDLQRCLDEKRALQTELNLLKVAGGAGGGSAQLERELDKVKKELDDCNRVNNVLRTENSRLRQRN